MRYRVTLVLDTTDVDIDEAKAILEEQLAKAAPSHESRPAYSWKANVRDIRKDVTPGLPVARELTDAEDEVFEDLGEPDCTIKTPCDTVLEIHYLDGKTAVTEVGAPVNGDPWIYDDYITAEQVLADHLRE